MFSFLDFVGWVVVVVVPSQFCRTLCYGASDGPSSNSSHGLWHKLGINRREFSDTMESFVFNESLFRPLLGKRRL